MIVMFTNLMLESEVKQIVVSHTTVTTGLTQLAFVVDFL